MPENTAKKKKYTLIAVLGVFIVIVGFSAFGGKKWLKSYTDDLIQREEQRLDSLQKKSDSIIGLQQEKADSLELVIQGLDFEIDDLSRRNTNLYWSLKKRNEEIQRLNDTSFVRNAEYIAERDNRYYQRKDSLK